jgi:DNA-binding beta-propeller fold protein YncE
MNALRFFLALAVAISAALPLRADRIVLVAGGGEERTGIPAAQAKLYEPFGADFDAAGNLFIVEMVSGNRLLRVNTDGVLEHIAGRREAGFGGDGGPALEARFNGPHNLAVLPDGNVLVGDTWNGRVRQVDVKAGRVTSLKGFNVPSAEARKSGPYCITLAPGGSRLLVADLRQIHEVNVATGESRVLAGNGAKGVPKDGGDASREPLVDPRAVAEDSRGNVYILERNGHALRVVSRDGKIRTVVNASGAKGASGDGGPALAATMNGPKHLCVDRDDTVILADAENHLIRRYDPKTGLIHRVAGTGKRGTVGVGGDPLQCGLARPHGVVVHPRTGELFIVDSYNDRVLKIVRGQGE